MDSAGALIALPGGPGTLTEISLAWNRLLVESLSPRPLIVIGETWRLLFEQFFRTQESYISASARSMLTFAATVEEAAEKLAQTSFASSQ
jgi:predicted Rossmann-fold nucleotide-binding protein